jgi:hypothetical protein
MNYAQESSYALIPPGKYRAKALSTSFGHTKNGNEELVIKFQITEGPQAGSVTYGRLYFTDAAAARSTEALGYLGFSGDFLELCEPHPDASGILPGECQIEVEHSEYQGKTSDRVKWINALYGKGGGAMKPAGNPLDDAAKREFAARMRAMTGAPAPTPVRAIGAGAGVKASAVQPARRAVGPAGPPVDETGSSPDDDIPF